MGEKNVLYQKLFDETSEAVFIINLEGFFIEANISACRMLGYEKEELLSLSYKDISAEVVKSEKYFMQRIGGEKLPLCVLQFRKKNEDIIFVEVNIQLVTDYQENDLYRNIEWLSHLDGNFICIVARQITEKISEQHLLKKIVCFSKDFSEFYEKELDYQKITKDFLELSEAKIASFHLYDEEGDYFTSMALVGDHRLIEIDERKHRGELAQNKWQHDPVVAKKINNNIITRFPSIRELLTDNISHPIALLADKKNGLGETIVIKMTKNNMIIGDFTFIMEEGRYFQKEEIVEVYTRQLGLVIAHKRIVEKLKVSEKSLLEASRIARLGRWEYDHTTNQLDWSDTVYEIFEMNKVAEQNLSEIYNSTVHPVDRERRSRKWSKSLEEKLPYEITLRLLMNDGTIKWVTDVGETVYNEQGVPLKTIGIVQDITENRQMESALQESEERLHLFFQQSLSGFFFMMIDNPVIWNDSVNKEKVLDYVFLHQRITKVNQSMLNQYRTTEEEFLNKTPYDFFKHDMKQGRRVWRELFDQGKLHIETKELRSDQTTIWVEGDYICLYDSKGQISGIFGTQQDITKRKKMEETIFADKERLKATLLSIGDGVISTNKNGTVTMLNNIAEILTGCTRKEAIGRPIDEVFNIINESTRKKAENLANRVIETGYQVSHGHDLVLVSKEGVERSIEDSVAPIKDDTNRVNGVVVAFRDVTEKKIRQREIEFLSFYDQLTGLYNRRFFEEELKRLNTPRNLPISLVIADINGLKLANDAFGHLIGDQFLIKAAEVIKRGCREDDIIARIGGDEFIIILPQTSSDEVTTIINRMKKLVAKEKISSIDLSISFGSETKMEKYESIRKIFTAAENNMYEKKLYESPIMKEKAVKTIVSNLYKKFPKEKAHSQRVGDICELVSKKIGLSNEEVAEVKEAGLMHDIGKVTINDKLIRKSGELDKTELLEVKRHSETGYQILRSVNEMGKVAEYVLAHHENWDGTGYPKGLIGEEIPLQSRIIRLVESYDAMVSTRSYKNNLSKDEAINEIKRKSGTHYDPEICKVFIEKVAPTLDRCN